MKSKLCSIAWFVLIFSVLGIIGDIIIFGTSLLFFVLNILTTIIIVFITNWACYSQCCNWFAWILVIFTGIGLLGTGFALKYQNSNIEIHKVIVEEKQKRHALGLL